MISGGVSFGPEGTSEDWSGGYRKVEEYLVKKRLVTERFLDRLPKSRDEAPPPPTGHQLLADGVADHFVELSENFVPLLLATLALMESGGEDAAIGSAIREALNVESPTEEGSS
jgi:hypothetical protein